MDENNFQTFNQQPQGFQQPVVEQQINNGELRLMEKYKPKDIPQEDNEEEENENEENEDDDEHNNHEDSD